MAVEGESALQGQLIEAQIPSSQYHEQGFVEGDTLLLSPRKAKVFLDNTHSPASV